MTDKVQYQLPAEWQTQHAVLLTWPHQDSDWQPWLEEVTPVFIEIAQTIARHQEVWIACHNDMLAQQIEQLLDLRNITIFITGNDDTWARDHGPISRYNLNTQQREILDFQFNGWGNKFDASLDNQINRQLEQQGAFENSTFIKQNLILEGGSIESDGLGTLLTTEQCLLNKNRNPELNKADIESFFQQELGIHNFLWLAHGDLIGDDTDAHIDTLARLCSKQDIAYCKSEPEDPHFAQLDKMAQQLAGFKNSQGEPYTLHALPLPKAIFSQDGQRLPATYANFLIINDAVLLPIYQDDNDSIAIKVLQNIFADRIIYAIDCRQIIEQYGSLHCLTMQIAKAQMPRPTS